MISAAIQLWFDHIWSEDTREMEDNAGVVDEVPRYLGPIVARGSLPTFSAAAWTNWWAVIAMSSDFLMIMSFGKILMVQYLDQS